eukprot:2769445-Lingulodinium_polyedra.AAC.1
MRKQFIVHDQRVSPRRVNNFSTINLFYPSMSKAFLVHDQRGSQLEDLSISDSQPRRDAPRGFR